MPQKCLERSPRRNVPKLLAKMGVLEAAQKRFWEKVTKTNKCWNWNGSKNKHGYGMFVIAGVRYLTHRLSYEFLKGEITNGLVIDHLCRNSGCVNPAHLEVVTTRVNVLRGIGLSAINIRKKVCIKGHPFTENNTKIRIRNSKQERVCITCRQAHHRIWHKRYRRRISRTAEFLVNMIKRVRRRIPKEHRWIVNDELKQLVPGHPFWSALNGNKKR